MVFVCAGVLLWSSVFLVFVCAGVGVPLTLKIGFDELLFSIHDDFAWAGGQPREVGKQQVDSA